MASVTSEQFERDSEADDEAFIDETMKCKYFSVKIYRVPYEFCLILFLFF